MYVLNGQYKTKVYNTRPIDKKNFNPMAHKLIDKGMLDGCIQVEILYLGDYMWITVREKDAVNE